MGKDDDARRRQQDELRRHQEAAAEMQKRAERDRIAALTAKKIQDEADRLRREQQNKKK
jgi:hypothetical protein